MPASKQLQEFDYCLDTFGDRLNGQAPTVGLQILKLAIKTLAKERYAYDFGAASKGELRSQMFEFSRELDASLQKVKLRIELTVEPSSVCDIRQPDNGVSSPPLPHSSPLFSNMLPSSLDFSRLPMSLPLEYGTQPFLPAVSDSQSDLQRLLATYVSKAPFVSPVSSPPNAMLYPDNSLPSLPFMSSNNVRSPSASPYKVNAPSTPGASETAIERSTSGVTEVYVDGLPFEASHEDILNLFSMAGEIVNITIVKSGCAFILFGSPSMAQRAILMFNLKVMPGFEKIRKPMRVSESRRQEDLSVLSGRHLHVMNVPARATRDELVAFFAQCGAVASIRLPPVRNSTSNNKGYGFVTYQHHEGADLALRMLSGKRVPGFEAEPKPLVVDYANGCKPSESNDVCTQLYL